MVVVGHRVDDDRAAEDVVGGAAAEGDAEQTDVDVGDALGVRVQVVHVAEVVRTFAGLAMRHAAGVEVPATIDDHNERYRLWADYFAAEAEAIRARGLI